MKTDSSAYLLIFRGAAASARYEAMSPEDRAQLLQQWTAWYDDLAAKGKLQHGRPLEPEGRVISAVGGRIIDGPFAESKEAIGGYFMLTVDSLDEATEIAKQCPSLRFGLTVEVRPVASSCPSLRIEESSEQELVNA